METFQKIKEIAKANKEGFTISILDYSFQKSGFVIAMNLTQNCFGDEGLKKIIEIAKNSTFLVGGWFDYQEQVYHYDCVMIEGNEKKAMELGKANGQKAIFSLENGKEIRL